MRTIMTIFYITSILYFPCAQNIHNLSTSAIEIIELEFRLEEFSDHEITEKIGEANTCVGNFTSLSCAWFSFEISDPCLLSFDLIPNIWNHDLDFVLYQAVGNGEKYILKRCMSDGLRLHDVSILNRRKVGRTGLMSASSFGSSKDRRTGYLAPLYTKARDRFLLLVTNYNASDGFALCFSREVKLAGRETSDKGLVVENDPEGM